MTSYPFTVYQETRLAYPPSKKDLFIDIVLVLF